MKNIATDQTMKLSKAVATQIDKLVNLTGCKGKEDLFSRCLGFKETDDKVKPSSAKVLTAPSKLSERGLNEVVADRLESYLAKIEEKEIKDVIVEILRLSKELQKHININKQNILDSLSSFYCWGDDFNDRIRAEEILHDQDKVKCVLVSSILFLLYYYKDDLDADSKCADLGNLAIRIKNNYSYYKGLFPMIFIEEGFDIKEHIDYDDKVNSVRINRENTYLFYEELNNDKTMLALLKNCLKHSLIKKWRIYKETECNRIVCDKYYASYSVQPPTEVIHCTMVNDKYKLSFIF